MSPDFLGNQGDGRPIMTIAGQLRGLAGRGFTGETRPELPPLAETVLLSLLGGEEMESCIAELGGALPPPKHQHGSLGIATVRLERGSVSVLGPCFSAPRVGGLLERLTHFGIRRLLALGWCGAVHPSVHVGDLLLPTSVIREEGTSYHYLPAGARPEPSAMVLSVLREAAAGLNVHVTEGPVWTTDAPYRETSTKVKDFAEAGVLGVDMETSAIISVGVALKIEVGVLLLVSDELWGREWNWGVPTVTFQEARSRYVKLAAAAGANLARIPERAL